MKWIYREKTEQQLKNWFYQKPKNKRGFKTFQIFFSWYNEFVKDKNCHYCGISERDIQKLVHYGVIKSKRFPKNGNIKRGVSRGYWLEIDRRNPNGKYYKKNCVPCCYFCNNDKSDIFTEEQYFKFKENRKYYLLSF